MRSFVDPLGFRYSSLHQMDGFRPGSETQTKGVVTRLDEQRGSCGIDDGLEFMDLLVCMSDFALLKTHIFLAGNGVEEVTAISNSLQNEPEYGRRRGLNRHSCGPHCQR